jgi:IclR family transcriptional regulator, KDG regulon repressor
LTTKARGSYNQPEMGDADLRYKTLKDLSRILSLFEVPDVEERSVSDIAKSLQMLPSKVSRMLKTMEIEGLVERSLHSGKYRIGARFLHLGLLYALNHPLRRVILPHVEQTASDLGLLSAWGIFKNGRAIIVDRVRSDKGPPVHLLGSDVPLHSSSYGKLFLAYMSREAQENSLQSFAFIKFTPVTIDNAELMKKEIARVREKGYAVDEGETREDLVGIAVPIFDESEELVAALTVSGRNSEFSKNRVAETIYLTEKALFISRQLGYRPSRNTMVP